MGPSVVRGPAPATARQRVAERRKGRNRGVGLVDRASRGFCG